MKAVQNSKRVTGNKAGPAAVPLMASTAVESQPAKPQPANGSTSPAIWNRYIDSRMKQFGTR
jgi:hypothetical protein